VADDADAISSSHLVSSWISIAIVFLSYPEAGLAEPPAPRRSGTTTV
jgi:hypothetical protein